MWIKNIVTLLCLFLSITSCVDEYWPDMDKYENLLVVDGLLTNGDDPVVVKLSVSSSLNNQELIPVRDGELYITDENQVITPLTETEPGTYQMSDSPFHGQVGKTYQLHINLPDGQQYISDICSLPDPSPIDSVYWVIESPEFSNSNHTFPGIQFYIDNHSNIADSSYYLWKLYQTFEYRSSFDIDYTWEGFFIRYPKPDSLRTCWRTIHVKDIYLSSTKYLDPPAITPFPLNFVSTETKLLSIRYSLLVKQLTISKVSFEMVNCLTNKLYLIG